MLSTSSFAGIILVVSCVTLLCGAQEPLVLCANDANVTLTFNPNIRNPYSTVKVTGGGDFTNCNGTQTIKAVRLEIANGFEISNVDCANIFTKRLTVNIYITIEESLLGILSFFTNKTCTLAGIMPQSLKAGEIRTFIKDNEFINYKGECTGGDYKSRRIAVAFNPRALNSKLDAFGSCKKDKDIHQVVLPSRLVIMAKNWCTIGFLFIWTHSNFFISL